jgi:hypothetical protein
MHQENIELYNKVSLIHQENNELQKKVHASDICEHLPNKEAASTSHLLFFHITSPVYVNCKITFLFPFLRCMGRVLMRIQQVQQ